MDQQPLNPPSENQGRAGSPKSRPIHELHSGSPNSANLVSFEHDVTNSTVLVVNGVRFVPRWASQRIRSYRNDWLLIVLDFIWISFLLCSGLTYLYLVFVLAFFGTETQVFSNTITLIIADWLEKNIASLVVIAFTVLLTTLVFWVSMHKIRNFPRTFLSALFIFSLALFNIFISHYVKDLLITTNPQNASERMSEFSRAKQFDQVGSILGQIPQNDAAPTIDPASLEAMDTVFEYPIRYYTDGLEDSDLFDNDPILSNYRDTVENFYNDGRYTDVLTLTCKMSSESNRIALLIYWRAATYRLAHHPDWGPEAIIDWENQLIQSDPRCSNLFSPFWTAIPSGIAWTIDQKKTINFEQLGWQFYFTIGAPEEHSIEEANPPSEIRKDCEVPLSDYAATRCEYDSRLLDNLFQKFPDAPYSEYVKFIRGQYDQILLEGQTKNPNLYDQAYYRKGSAQYAQGNFEGSLKTFQSFLFNDAFKEHPWRDDARYRIAESYLKLGKYIDALDNYIRAKSEPDGKLPAYAQIDPSILYAADVVMPIPDLENIVDLNLFPDYQPLLKYTLAERYLADHTYEKASKTFQQVIEEYGDQIIVPDPKFTYGNLVHAYTYGELARRKLKSIESLSYYEKTSSPENLLSEANYLESFETFSPFENDLRYLIPMFQINSISADYLTKRSRAMVTIQLREKFLNENPTDPRAPDVLMKVAKGYETIASWMDLPDSSQFYVYARDHAVSGFIEYIQKYPNFSKENLDYALEHAGSVYLLDCSKRGYIDCSPKSMMAIRIVYQELVKQFPRHHLANNMLNWIAWTYCYDANRSPINKAEYVSAYENALSVYEQIVANYPDGLTGQNARDNIVIIKEKLRNPDDQTKLPMPEWGWYTK